MEVKGSGNREKMSRPVSREPTLSGNCISNKGCQAVAKRVGKVFPWLVIFSWRRRRQEPLCGACGFKGRADGRLLAGLLGWWWFVRSLLHPPYQTGNRREQNWNGVSSSLLRLECVEMMEQKVREGKEKEREGEKDSFQRTQDVDMRSN